MPLEIRRLIREMSLANPLWGTPRILGDSSLTALCSQTVMLP